MTTVSVKDIAEKIQRPDEPLQSAIDRLRNWTKEGLIVPSGEKHPGTGRARQYPRKVLFEAALLQVLIDCTGIAAVSAADLLNHAKIQIAPLIKAGEFDDAVLVIGRSIGVSNFYMGVGKYADLPAMLNSAIAEDTHTIVNLRRVADRVFTQKD